MSNDGTIFVSNVNDPGASAAMYCSHFFGEVLMTKYFRQNPTKLECISLGEIIFGCCFLILSSRGVQITGARLPCRLNFVFVS